MTLIRRGSVGMALPIVFCAFSLMASLVVPVVAPPLGADRWTVSREELAGFSEIQLNFSGLHAFKQDPLNPLETEVWARADFAFPGFTISDEMGRSKRFPLTWTGDSFSMDIQGTADEINLHSHGRMFPGTYTLKANGTINLPTMTLTAASFSWAVVSDDGRNHVACALHLGDLPPNFAFSTAGKSLKMSVFGPAVVRHVSGINGMLRLKDWCMGAYQTTDWTGLRLGTLQRRTFPPQLTMTFFRH